MATEPSPQAETRPPGLIRRLRARGVLRVAASYAVIAWLLLQIASVVLDPLGVPTWVMTALIVTAVAGLPVAIALAWLLGRKARGIDGDVDIADAGVARPATRGPRHYADMIVIGVLVIAVALLAVRQSGIGKPKPPENPAIAVLPFENLSGDPNQEYFSDGLAEETIDRLGRVPGLRVIARSSSFSFKGKNVDATTIADKLRVTTILEGSVRRDGKHLKLSARLVDGATGQETWSGSFDRQMTDVFKVQAELARAVVDAIIPAARGEVVRQPPPAEADLSAYELYLLAKSTEWQRTPEAVKRTVQLLERSIERDPNYAPAHAQLAMSLYTSIIYAGRDPKTTREQVTREAHAAIALDPTLPQAQLAQALATENGEAVDESRAAFRRIAERYPNYAPAMFYYSNYVVAGNGAAARHWLEKALAVDPLAISPRLNLIKSLYDVGDMKAVTVQLERYEELHASDLDSQLTLGRAVLKWLSDPIPSVTAARRYIALSSQDPAPEAAVALHRALIAIGDSQAAAELVRRTDWSTALPGALAYEQALAAGASNDMPALSKAIESLRRLPVDPARDSALLLWLAVAGDCKGALLRKEGALQIGGPRNYTMTGFKVDDMYLAADWCTHGLGAQAKGHEDLTNDLAQTEASLAVLPKSVDDLIASAALHSMKGDDETAIERLARAVERAPLAINFNPVYPWFARLAGQPKYDRLVEKRLQAQAGARARITAALASEVPIRPAKP